MILEASPLTEKQTSDAVSHYIECLNLPPQSNILIVTDKPSDSSEINVHRDLRIHMSSLLDERLRMNEFPLQTLHFDNSMTEEEMYDSAKRALEDFQSSNTVTIIYLGDSWLNRGGMYNAASEYGKNNEVRVAGSLGFTTGDARVLSQMDASRRAIIEETNDYFEKFLNAHPRGTFIINTSDFSDTQYYLGIPYDTSEAEFVSSLGIFDSRTHKVDGFAYTNTPVVKCMVLPINSNMHLAYLWRREYDLRFMMGW